MKPRYALRRAPRTPRRPKRSNGSNGLKRPFEAVEGAPRSNGSNGEMLSAEGRRSSNGSNEIRVWESYPQTMLLFGAFQDVGYGLVP